MASRRDPAPAQLVTSALLPPFLRLRWCCRRHGVHDGAPRHSDHGGDGPGDRRGEDHLRGRHIELKRDNRGDGARDGAFNQIADETANGCARSTDKLFHLFASRPDSLHRFTR